MQSKTLLVPLALLFVMTASQAQHADAQITMPRTLSASETRLASLEERLINRLRATTGQQQAFIRFAVLQVNNDRLETRLLLAIERFAINRNRHLPFNYFERALRFEASRRGVALPPVQQFVSTADSD